MARASWCVLLSLALAPGCSLIVDTECREDHSYCPTGHRCSGGRCVPVGDADADTDADVDADLDADVDIDFDGDPDNPCDGLEAGASCEGTVLCRRGETCNDQGVCDPGSGEAYCEDDEVGCTRVSCTEELGCEQIPDPSLCPHPPECMENVCDLVEGCIQITLDGDDDGFCAPGCLDSVTGEIGECSDGDCDDVNAGRNPGLIELCTNGMDDNCDGVTDAVPGALIDTPRAIAGSTLFRTFPTVVWNGHGFAAAWLDEVVIHPGVFFALLSDAGVVTSGPTRVSDAAARGCEHPSLVYTGDGYRLAWSDDRDGGNGEIYFARLTEAGEKVGDDIRITDSVTESADPSLAWNGFELGLAWSDNSDICFLRLNRDGGRISEDIVPVTDDPGWSVAPALVWADTVYGLAWSDARDGNSEIYFTSFAPTDLVIANRRITDEPAGSMTPSLAWNGFAFGLAWADERTLEPELYFAEVQVDGLVSIAATPVTVDDTNGSASPSLTWAHGEYGLAWIGDVLSDDDPYFARLSEAGGLVGTIVRLSSDFSSIRPSIASSRSEYVVLWDQENAADGDDVFLARLGRCL
jgi:hypothetical protein